MVIATSNDDGYRAADCNSKSSEPLFPATQDPEQRNEHLGEFGWALIIPNRGGCHGRLTLATAIARKKVHFARKHWIRASDTCYVPWLPTKATSDEELDKAER